MSGRRMMNSSLAEATSDFAHAEKHKTFVAKEKKKHHKTSRKSKQDKRKHEVSSSDSSSKGSSSSSSHKKSTKRRFSPAKNDKAASGMVDNMTPEDRANFDLEQERVRMLRDLRMDQVMDKIKPEKYNDLVRKVDMVLVINEKPSLAVKDPMTSITGAIKSHMFSHGDGTPYTQPAPGGVNTHPDDWDEQNKRFNDPISPVRISVMGYSHGSDVPVTIKMLDGTSDAIATKAVWLMPGAVKPQDQNDLVLLSRSPHPRIFFMTSTLGDVAPDELEAAFSRGESGGREYFEISEVVNGVENGRYRLVRQLHIKYLKQLDEADAVLLKSEYRNLGEDDSKGKRRGIFRLYAPLYRKLMAFYQQTMKPMHDMFNPKDFSVSITPFFQEAVVGRSFVYFTLEYLARSDYSIIASRIVKDNSKASKEECSNSEDEEEVSESSAESSVSNS